MERTHLPEAVPGPRLELRRAEPVAADTRDVIDRERARFLLYFPMLEPSLAGSALSDAFAREARTLWEGFEEYAYELRERTTGEFIGHASVHALAWKHECAELAYWVRESGAGKGYVSEAVGVLERMLFTRGFHRVEIRCDVLNVESRKVAERCGYTLDGRLREHMKRRDGSYRDSYVFGKLAHEAK